MPEVVVNVRGTRADILRVIREIPAACEGGRGDVTNAVQGMMTRLGMTLLGRIKSAFVVKSHGGTDDCGLSWQKLAPSTVAYGRRHPGVPYPGKKRAPFAPSWMLTEKQRKRWWALYRLLSGTAPAGSAYHAKGSGGGGWAAIRAWQIIKAEGGQTLIGTYGDTQVDILRDTDLLLNSLSPGVPGEVPNQVFKIGRGDVIVGTNRKWAAAHHNGIPGKLPQRRLWAEPRSWPESWWRDLLEQGKAGLIEITLFMLSRKAA